MRHTALIYWCPPLLWLAVIFALSGDLGSSHYSKSLLRWLLAGVPFLTPAQIDVLHFYLRRLAHVLAYSTLYLLWFRTLRGYYGWRLWSSVFGVGLLCLLVASLDEGHQAFLNTRSGRVWDVALDMAGVTMAALVSPFFWKPGCAPVPVASPGAPSL